MRHEDITARDVADYFLSNVDEESGDNISNLKLQKLLYYAQGFSLAMHGKPIFSDPIEAWQHGPVVPHLYRTFREYGAGAIPPTEGFDASKFSQEATDLLDEVWQVYGQFSALKLREMTHEETPWKQTTPNDPIPLAIMQEYFKALVIDGQE